MPSQSCPGVGPEHRETAQKLSFPESHYITYTSGQAHHLLLGSPRLQCPKASNPTVNGQNFPLASGPSTGGTVSNAGPSLNMALNRQTRLMGFPWNTPAFSTLSHGKWRTLQDTPHNRHSKSYVPSVSRYLQPPTTPTHVGAGTPGHRL